MLATQDVWDIEVPLEDTRSRGERLIDKARFVALVNLSLAQDAAEFAATDEYEADGATTSIDWIRINCHMTGPQAANYVAVGEQINKLPADGARNGRGGDWLWSRGLHGQGCGCAHKLTHGSGLQ
jgi:hypothetical protein